MTNTDSTLAGLRVVDLSINLPGPLASARLRELGAPITTVVPPGGDPLRRVSPEWGAKLAAGKEACTLNLKEPADRAQLGTLLGQTDLLLTATRPSALRRLGLDWTSLHAQYPRLCQVAIVGH